MLRFSGHRHGAKLAEPSLAIVCSEGVMSQSGRRRRKISAILREQKKAFRKKFGRDPRPDEPVFFDPTSDVPIAVSERGLACSTGDLLRRAEAPPHVVYIYKKTGRVVTPLNFDLIPPEGLAEVRAALEEYRALEQQAQARSKSQAFH
jgi:hypothetical protein